MVKKYSLIFIAFLCFSLSGFGQTTVTYDFSDSGVVTGLSENSPGIALDANIGFGSFQNSGTSNPALNSGQLRLYQNSTKGGSIRIYPSNGAIITSVVVRASSATGNAGYNSDGSFVSNLTGGSTYTMSGLSATSEVEFYQRNGSTRIYVDSFEVTYTFPSTDTELNFASTTYAANEGDGTVSICVDITNESATPTTANIALTSTNAPHVTYSTTGITFPANSSTQQCVTINLANNTNCFDATDYTFELQSVSGGSSASVGANDETTLSVSDDDGVNGVFKTLSFEGSDDWGYSGGGTVENDFNKYFGTNSYRIGGSNNLTTDNISLAGFSNVSLSVAFASVSADSNEDLYLEISYDNGSNWNDSGSIKLVDGYSNANINMGNTNGSNPTTVGSNPWTVNIDPSETQIKVRLRVTSLDSNEYYYVDDIILSGESCSTPMPEINIQGNTTDIADGNTAISTTDDTDFGDVLVGNSEAHTFTIQNTGTADLDLTTITSSNSDFIVSAYTNPTTVTDGNSTTFIVTFTPTTTGTSTSTITILSNDANEATYNFNVEGNGTAIPSIVLSSTNPAVAASNITDGTDDNVIYAFNLSVLNYEAELTAFNFTTSGTATNADITNFKVWYSTNATFNAGSDTTLQTITTSLGSGSHAVSGISQTIANGSTGYIFITTDLPCGATDGRTITVNAITTGNLTFTTGNKSGIAYASGTHTITEAIPNNVTALATANCENGGSDISWTTATGCSDDYIVVASTSPLTTSPSGNGSSYTANTTFGSGTTYDSGFVVYKGSGTSVSVSGLTNGTQYYYTVFTRNGESWSSGNEVDCTQLIGYCPSYADSATDDDTGIINVTFNTINETSSGDPAYTDFTSISTDVVPGQSYELSVSVDVFGFQNYSKAWIDWNGDGIFNTSTEEYDLGDTYDPEVLVAYSPLNITVPLSASIGSVRMRVATQYFYNVPSDPIYLPETLAPCETLYEYGEVEDYTINVITPCTPTHTFTSMLPTSGPEDTEITVTGTGFTASTTANFEGVSATVDFIDATTLIIHVPTGATTSNISIAEMGCNVQTGTFTVIEDGGSCVSSSGGSFTDIIISEVYDSNGLNGWYMELYNPTGVPVDLGAGDYELERYGEYTDATPSLTIDLTGTIAPYSPFVMRLGDSSNPCNTTSFDLVDTGSGINETDKIILTKGGADLDVVHTPNEKGYSIFRNPDASGPTTTFSAADWTTDSSEDCSNLGIGPEIIVSSPTISAITDASDCSVLDYSVTATAGNSGTLTYQWYFNNGVNDVWTAITSASPAGFTILGEDGDNLLMEGDANALSDLANYQFYCEVTEDGSCTSVSNAIKPNYNIVTWNGSWSSTPDIYSTVILDDDYDTSVGGVQTSFSACSLIINSGAQLTIANNTFVKVENDLNVNGEIIVNTDGAFVQVNNYGIIDGAVLTTRNKITVEKQTAYMATAQEYTYWSAPVEGELISNGLAEANPSRIYWYKGQNYLDKTKEANNNNATVIGQDDIDDNADDWQNASGSTVMAPGVGYGSTHNGSVAFTPAAYTYYFEGPFNNGIYNVPIYRNDSETNDNNWNLIGNPYPSAIDADVFLAANASIGETVAPMTGAIFFWSHATAATANTNGNENLNYAQSDYAIINGSGETKGGDEVTPNRFIPSGQAFFIAMDDASPANVVSGTIKTTDVVFNNSMRVTGNNDQFFRATTTNQSNKLWLNLNTDNGAFNQILIAYVNGATDEDDGMYFDAQRNLSTDVNAVIYSLLEDSNSKQFAIQGKEPNNLTLEEVIPLGLITSISEPTIYTISIDQFEGAFMTENAVYINDKLLNTFHNLKTSDYTFTSETGTFNDRFEIVFRPTTLLSIDDNLIKSNEVTLTELQNGDIEIKVGHTHTIKHVDIIDITGRRVYSLQGHDATEVYNVSKLSQAAYIAKITLSNGQVISKKAIKQK